MKRYSGPLSISMSSIIQPTRQKWRKTQNKTNWPCGINGNLYLPLLLLMKLSPPWLLHYPAYPYPGSLRLSVCPAAVTLMRTSTDPHNVGYQPLHRRAFGFRVFELVPKWLPLRRLVSFPLLILCCAVYWMMVVGDYSVRACGFSPPVRLAWRSRGGGVSGSGINGLKASAVINVKSYALPWVLLTDTLEILLKVS